MSPKYSEYFDLFKQAVEDDRVVLPTLPDVALKIRDTIDDCDVTTEQIADIIAQDPALSVRLIKVVNSPLYRGEVPIDDLQMAVTRMGSRLVKDLVINLAIKQLYTPTSELMEKHFRSAWSTSVNVAAICQLMTLSVPGVRKEQAVLAGLIHNIGTLPLLMYAASDKEMCNDSKELNLFITALRSDVGSLMLASWNFSADLIDVVSHCHDVTYDDPGASKLLKLVQLALLQGEFISDVPDKSDWQNISAFSDLGLDATVNLVHLEENQEILDNARKSILV